MKRRIRLTESDLKRIVKESVKRVLRESSFNPERNLEMYKERMKSELDKLNIAMGRAMTSMDHIAHFAGDEEIERRARIIINAIAEADRSMLKVNQLVSADRWDVSN